MQRDEICVYGKRSSYTEVTAATERLPNPDLKKIDRIGCHASKAVCTNESR
jgi:hypothetical protein